MYLYPPQKKQLWFSSFAMLGSKFPGPKEASAASRASSASSRACQVDLSFEA